MDPKGHKGERVPKKLDCLGKWGSCRKRCTPRGCGSETNCLIQYQKVGGIV